MIFREKLTKELCDFFKDYDTSLLYIYDKNDRYTLVRYGDEFDEKTGEVRGWIVDCNDKENLKVVCKSFPYTPLQVFDGKQQTIQYEKYQVILEGTIVRAWSGYDNENNQKLYVSTHGKLDCSNSRWGSKKTFKQMFDEAINIMKFDTKKFMDGNVYIMMLVHPENQITNLYNVKFPSIFHLETLNSNMERIECNIGISIVPYINKKQTYDFMMKGGHGVVSCGFDNKIKLVSPMYNCSLNIVGAGNSLFHRYIELKNECNEKYLVSVVPKHKINEVTSFEMRYNELIHKAVPYLTDLFIHWKKTGERIDVRYHKFFITIKDNENPNIMKIVKGALFKYNPVFVKKICKKIISENEENEE